MALDFCIWVAVLSIKENICPGFRNLQCALFGSARKIAADTGRGSGHALALLVVGRPYTDPLTMLKISRTLSCSVVRYRSQ